MSLSLTRAKIFPGVWSLLCCCTFWKSRETLKRYSLWSSCCIPSIDLGFSLSIKGLLISKVEILSHSRRTISV